MKQRFFAPRSPGVQENMLRRLWGTTAAALLLLADVVTAGAAGGGGDKKPDYSWLPPTYGSPVWHQPGPNTPPVWSPYGTVHPGAPWGGAGIAYPAAAGAYPPYAGAVYPPIVPPPKDSKDKSKPPWPYPYYPGYAGYGMAPYGAYGAYPYGYKGYVPSPPPPGASPLPVSMPVGIPTPLGGAPVRAVPNPGAYPQAYNAAVQPMAVAPAPAPGPSTQIQVQSFKRLQSRIFSRKEKAKKAKKAMRKHNDAAARARKKSMAKELAKEV